MTSSEIVGFLKTESEPLPHRFYGSRYRAAAYLTDGTYLPCVVFQSERKQVDLALRRFGELKNKPEQYRSVVATFVANKSSVAGYKVIRVEASPFAWPLSTLRKIHGETTMGWTAFVVEMNDGRRFSYGTSFEFEFFDLPQGYCFQDIKEIHSGMVHLESDGMKPFTIDRQSEANCFREKPFFNCYLEGLDDTDPNNELSRVEKKRGLLNRWFSGREGSA